MGSRKGEGILECSGVNPGRGDGPHRPIEILLPRTENESIGWAGGSSLGRFRFTSFFLGGSSLVEIGDLLRLWRERLFAKIVLEQASVADEDGAEG